MKCEQPITLQQRDRAIIWHPFTQMQTASEAIPMVKGKGAYLYDETGHAYLDMISSWWVNIHGHAHPAIATAIAEQANTLEQVIFAGCTHEPAVVLAEQLCAHLPAEFKRVFYSDNGSTAVEVALKMAYQFWLNKKNSERCLFLSFEGGYHGDTIGAMSAGGSSAYHQHFKKLLFQSFYIPFPETWENDPDVEQKETDALAALDQYLDQYGEKTAALIVEPLIQGAAGMRFCRPGFLERVLEKIKQHHILIIFDEVMTGFGRTGTLFALESFKIKPDILCLSKGLTGGFLPMAVTITQEPIYESFLGETFDTAFAHGHSYTANPLGCAASIASLALFKTEQTLKKISELSHIHQERLPQLTQYPCIKAIRTRGAIAAFNVVDKNGEAIRLAKTLRDTLLAQGILLRPLGHTLYLMPPYCISGDELRGVYDQLENIISKSP